MVITMIDKQLLKKYCLELDIPMSDISVEKLDTYAETLVEWNKVMNLTAITEPDEIVVKHFIDSMLLLVHAQIKENATFIDVGTGAGFPALPCKIIRNDLQITLLDSLNKRINFLNEVVKNIDIKAKTVHARAEEAGSDAKFREKYDIATARAVAHLRELSEYTLPFVKVGGYFIALKGGDITQELEEARNAICLLGGEVEKVVEYTLPDESNRAMIIIKKIKGTDNKYPRSYAKMKKAPLN